MLYTLLGGSKRVMEHIECIECVLLELRPGTTFHTTMSSRTCLACSAASASMPKGHCEAFVAAPRAVLAVAASGSSASTAMCRRSSKESIQRPRSAVRHMLKEITSGSTRPCRVKYQNHSSYTHEVILNILKLLNIRMILIQIYILSITVDRDFLALLHVPKDAQGLQPSISLSFAALQPLVAARCRELARGGASHETPKAPPWLRGPKGRPRGSRRVSAALGPAPHGLESRKATGERH